MEMSLKSTVSLIKCDTYEYQVLIPAIRKLLEPLGGLSSYVKPGDTVLLKPNLLTALHPEKAATTHPHIIGAVGELVREAGGNPVCGDSPGIHSLEKVAAATHIDQLGIPYADFKNSDDVVFSEAHLCKKFSIAKAVRDADVIINLPKLKTHGQMAMTCAVKNMFGCVPGLRKAQFHFKMQKKEDFGMMLVDLYKYVKPALSIVDSIIAMEGNGPGSGDPRKLGFLGASHDAVALDSVCADIIGLKPDNIPYLIAARTVGAGAVACEQIAVLGEDKESFKTKDFVLPAVMHNMHFTVPVPHWIFKRFFTPKPVINKKQCKKCYECISICPAQPKALSAASYAVPRFKYTQCIRCFCCQEICPHKAIKIKASLLSKLIG